MDISRFINIIKYFLPKLLSLQMFLFHEVSYIDFYKSIYSVLTEKILINFYFNLNLLYRIFKNTSFKYIFKHIILSYKLKKIKVA